MGEMYKLYSDGRDSMLYFQEWESTSRFMSVCLFYLIETINSVNSMFIHCFPIILSKYLLCYTWDYYTDYNSPRLYIRYSGGQFQLWNMCTTRHEHPVSSILKSNLASIL